jgi:hypothetical protein
MYVKHLYLKITYHFNYMAYNLIYNESEFPEISPNESRPSKTYHNLSAIKEPTELRNRPDWIKIVDCSDNLNCIIGSNSVQATKNMIIPVSYLIYDRILFSSSNESEAWVRFGSYHNSRQYANLMKAEYIITNNYLWDRLSCTPQSKRFVVLPIYR